MGHRCRLLVMPNYAAVHAAMRNRRRQGYSHVSAARHRENMRWLEEQKSISKLMRKYDLDKSGDLDRGQLKKMMTETHTNGCGQEPSDEEVEFVLKVADKSKSDSITREEVMLAMQVWSTYCAKKSEIDTAFDNFDSDKSGSLSKEQLKNYLVHLNDNEPVDDEDVEFVFTMADVMGDGVISKPELLRATALWYSQCKKKSSCCTVL